MRMNFGIKLTFNLDPTFIDKRRTILMEKSARKVIPFRSLQPNFARQKEPKNSI